MNASDLIRIMQFGDSVLPVGAFTFSNGVESAIQTGIVHDVATLKGFVLTALKQAASCDGMGVVVAHRAVVADDRDGIIRADWAVNNRKLNEESRLMATRMGKKAGRNVDPCGGAPIDQLVVGTNQKWQHGGHLSGDSSGGYGSTRIGQREVVVMHQYGVAMTILSAAMRLMRVTHFDTQHILFELNHDIEKFCDIAEIGDINQMSSYVPIVDVLAAVHVKAHVRLFSN